MLINILHFFCNLVCASVVITGYYSPSFWAAYGRLSFIQIALKEMHSKEEGFESHVAFNSFSRVPPVISTRRTFQDSVVLLLLILRHLCVALEIK